MQEKLQKEVMSLNSSIKNLEGWEVEFERDCRDDVTYFQNDELYNQRFKEEQEEVEKLTKELEAKKAFKLNQLTFVNALAYATKQFA